jgi:hypothetical protein
MSKGFNRTGGKVQTKKILILLLIILILIFPLSLIEVISESEDNNSSVLAETENDKNTEIPTESGNRGNDSWQLVTEIEETVDIKKGSDFFVKVSPRANNDEKLTIKSPPEPDSVLSPSAVTAVAQAPNWIQNDLANKFIDLAQLDITLTGDAYSAFGDLDADGDYDLICSSESSELTYYENRGTAYESQFLMDEAVFKDINSKIDLYSADPSFGDVDSDGDLDIVVGNADGDLGIVFNHGDPVNPVFHSSHFYSEVVSGYLSPCFVDIDGDGDLDIFSGAEDGRLYINENTGTPTNYLFSSSANSYEFIDVGSRSKPCFFDMDNDGDLDLTIGESTNNLNYYRNTGTISNPNWRVDTTMYLGLTLQPGTAPELVDLNGDRRQDLIVGFAGGRYYFYENIGTVFDAQWQTYSTYNIWPGIEYYEPTTFLKCVNHSVINKYAQLILTADAKFKDEIAFSIANTPTQVLVQTSAYPVYKLNAELLYEIDAYLDYANIKDYGSYDKGDYYSTVEYKYKKSPSGSILTTELPRDIYYWYVVHPKLSDEMPAFINPASGEPAVPPTGRFWREYLFYNADTEYPSDPPTDVNDDGIPDFHYPKDEPPPLLKDRLAGIKYLYDSEPYNAPSGYKNNGYNNSRPWGYKDHAIEVISNWVAKTLPLNEQESADGERPIQPVRIARMHNGNCGELQDLTTAAARTALIPIAGVMLWGEDHVWSEFYDRGWHQWDNYWSDGGAVVDNFMNYWVGWGQRGGSGVSKWHGNDYVSEATQRYVPEEDLTTLIFHVNDRNGNPVDGARVMVSSYWTTVDASGYQVDIPFPSIWNYTDNNGMCELKVATQEGMANGNKNFSLRVISKLGNAEEVKIELDHGGQQEFWFNLEGTAAETGLDLETLTIPPSKDRYKLEINYELEGAYQLPPNPMVGNYHPQPLSIVNYINGFVCDENNYNYYLGNEYRNGEPVDVYYSSGDSQVGNISFELFTNDNIYYVFYNKKSIETYKTLRLTARLFEKPDDPPQLSILEPEDFATFEVGSKITINGTAIDDRGIEELRLRMGSSGGSGPFDFDITNTLKDGLWEYTWDTTKLINGTYIIKVIAYDTNENYGVDHIYINLVDPPPPPPADETPPEIEIIKPLNQSIFTIGDEISFSGSATDNIEVSALTLTVASRTINILSSLSDSKWSYSWDSGEQRAGIYKFNILGIDPSGNNMRRYGNFELIEPFIDDEPPRITIIKPSIDEIFGLGETITLEGTVSDNVGVESLMINLDDGQWVDLTSTHEGTSWTYLWSTAGLPIGWHSYTIYATDSTGNSDELKQAIQLIDNIAPTVSITSPAAGSQITRGTTIGLEGEVNDNVEIDTVHLTITGVGGIDERIKRGIEVEIDRWDYSWEIPTYYSSGEYSITVTATDSTGNTESESITINIIAEKNAEKDKDKGMFGLPGFESVLFIFAVLFVLIIGAHSYKRKYS